VDFFWNERTGGDNHGAAVALELTEETTPVTLVADAGAHGIDEEEQSVSIAIQADFFDTEKVAAGLALLPELLARAGVKMDFASPLRRGKRFLIQIAKHQYFAGALVLDDAGNESIEFFESEIHTSLPKTKNPLGGSRQRAD
jgi:hypothetical protein